MLSTLQPTLTPSLLRLHRAATALEDAETERDAAVAAAIINGHPAAEVAASAGLPASTVERIAEVWGCSSEA
jgi:hypothetical protein